MDWVETTGKSIEAAKDAALELLGVDASDAEFQVLDDAKTGLFGRVKSEARVRARVRPTTPRPKVERRDRRSSRSTKAEGAAEGDAGHGAGGRGRGGRDGGRSSGGASAKRGGNGAATKKSPAEEPTAAKSADAVRARVTKETVVPVDADMSVDEQAEHAEEFLRGLLSAFGMTGDLNRETVDTDIREVQVSGSDVGLLVGSRGRTLDALQDVVRTVVQKHAGASDKRVRVDVAGYRVRRRDALAEFARQCAEEVQASGVARALEPMSSPDRKAVHDALVDVEGVVTTSEGEEPRRRVVISPAS